MAMIANKRWLLEHVVESSMVMLQRSWDLSHFRIHVQTMRVADLDALMLELSPLYLRAGTCVLGQDAAGAEVALAALAARLEDLITPEGGTA